MLVRDVPKASKFYTEGLGLTVIASSDKFTELSMNNETTLGITQASK